MGPEPRLRSVHLVLLETSNGRFSAQSPELPGVVIRSTDELTARRLIAEALSAAKKPRRRSCLTGILFLSLGADTHRQ